MKTVAVYNMKGGVGKTTAAVNLSYLAAAAGRRVLLWDLDPQAAASFALRVRPRVEGFGRKSLESGEALGASVKATDYPNLDLLPADFAYRKFDRFLEEMGKPKRVVASLLDTLGRDYDVVLLDCPAGFSLLIEGIFAASDMVLVPAIPTVLSLRMVARLIKWAERSDAPCELAVFFSMVDRRKGLHRRACEWSDGHRGVFLDAEVPYASVVEQMAVRRLPLAVFAGRDVATLAFTHIWTEIQTRLGGQEHVTTRQSDGWRSRLLAVESLIARLEPMEGPEASIDPRAAGVVHRFDTPRRDLQRAGYVLEFHERQGHLLVVVSQSAGDHAAEAGRRAEARIDSSWAVEILSGEMSPLAALERRLGRPGPHALEDVRGLVGNQRLLRIESRAAATTDSVTCERRTEDVVRAGATTLPRTAPAVQF